MSDYQLGQRSVHSDVNDFHLAHIKKVEDERDQALAALRRLHTAAKIVTAYEWPQDASPMGAMDEFDAAMAEAETILNPSKKGESTEQQ